MGFGKQVHREFLVRSSGCPAAQRMRGRTLRAVSARAQGVDRTNKGLKVRLFSFDESFDEVGPHF
jgi:hypothetical protein